MFDLCECDMSLGEHAIVDMTSSESFHLPAMPWTCINTCRGRPSTGVKASVCEMDVQSMYSNPMGSAAFFAPRQTARRYQRWKKSPDVASSFPLSDGALDDVPGHSSLCWHSHDDRTQGKRDLQWERERETQATHVFLLWPGLHLTQSTKREGDKILIMCEGHSTLILYILKIIFNNNQ